MPPRPTRQRTPPSSRYERAARDQGYQRIAGVDEVGRGCLFGPVVAAAVILDPDRPIRGLADSKLLDPGTREELDVLIRERAAAYALGSIDADVIDRVNIYQAARQAMEQAVKSLSPQPDYLLVDAMKLGFYIPQQSIIKGDLKCRSIAAASIIAKVERDRRMVRWSEQYPEYDLASNKGYGTPAHLAALRERGPTPQHRMSFAPVAEAAGITPSHEVPVQGALIFEGGDH